MSLNVSFKNRYSLTTSRNVLLLLNIAKSLVPLAILPSGLTLYCLVQLYKHDILSIIYFVHTIHFVFIFNMNTKCRDVKILIDMNESQVNYFLYYLLSF